MLTRQKNAFLKIAIIFLPVIVIIAGITIPSFAAQSDPAPKAGSSSGKEAVGEEKVGLFRVQIGSKYGFIDKTGKIVIKPQFDDALLGFFEGLAEVQIGGKWGYIDKSGNIVIKPQFDGTSGFQEGLAKVFIGGKEAGYIDKTGRYVWEPTR
jgi:hypothetical protein